MATVDNIVGWFKTGNEKSQALIDLKWNLTTVGDYILLQNDKIPFMLYLNFENDKNTMHILVRTGIETATIENQPRLTIYRTLLILNQRVELVKFMLDSINEEVVAREDLTMDTLTKDDLNAALNTLITAFYLMVQALKLQDEFNEQIIERTYMMIKDMLQQGKTRDEIKKYLKVTIGLGDEEAEELISQVLDSDKTPKNMYQ